IVKKLLIESFVIALVGGALGLLMAVWVRNGLIALSPGEVSRFQQISFDLPVLSFTFLVASLTTVLFGLWPAWQASHRNVQLALRTGSAGSGDPPSAKRARDWQMAGHRSQPSRFSMRAARSGATPATLATNRKAPS